MKLLLSSVVSSAASLLVAAFCTPRNCLQKQFIRATSSTAHTFSPRSSTGLVLPTNTLDSIQRIRAGAARSLSSTTDTDDNDNTTIMSESKTPPDEYVPPKVWIHDAASGGKWAKINRPESGALHQKELPVGKHPLQLYSWATPNGIKATIMLEELLELGITEAEYDAWLIRIDGDQFGSGFVELNPNSKIPALMDHTADADADADTGSGEKDQEPLRVFESGSILMYLGDKFGKLIPPITDWRDRTECMNWVMWQMGSAPFVGGGFGHFYTYAPYKMEYAINRYTMETKRQLDVLDKHLAKKKYMLGDTYTVADIAIWSWYGQLALEGRLYDGSFEFLDMESYTHVVRWAKLIWERPAVKRGIKVNRTFGALEDQLWERHAASDFETQTQDKKQTEDEKKEEEVDTSSPKRKYPKRMSENMFQAPMSKKEPKTED